MGERAARLSFLILLLVLMVAFIAIIRPFLFPALLAFLITVICYPLHERLLKWLRGRKYIASFMSTLIVCLCILIPLSVVIAIAAVNSVDLVRSLTARLETGEIAQTVDHTTRWIQERLAKVPGNTLINLDLRSYLIDFFTSLGKLVYRFSPRVFSATLNMVGGLLLMALFNFVFFAEGKALLDSILGLFPLAHAHKRVLSREIASVITATFLGMIVTAVAQGVLIGLGFWLAGIANSFIWGILAIGITLIPLVGAPLMYVPAAVAQVISGHHWWGVFLFLYGVGVVSTIDNIIKPLVMRGKVKVHPVLLALSILGGGMWIGVPGIIVGPMVVVVMLAMLRIYRQEFMEGGVSLYRGA